MKRYAAIECQRIISEPGDATRYDYIVYENGPDNYCFMPCNNTFIYPQQINYYDVAEITEINDTVESIAEKYNCNPWTVLECIRTVQELQWDKHGGKR